MINFKNLGKALKYNRSCVFWFRTEKYNYLFTGYWGIKTTKLLHIEKGIFTTLINTFQAIPEVSKGYEISNYYIGPKQIDEQRIKILMNLIDNMPSDEIVYTDLIRKVDSKETLILKAPENYIFVDRKFMDFIDITPDTKLYGRGPNNAIYAQYDDEVAVILPVRFDNISDYLKPIEGMKHLKS